MTPIQEQIDTLIRGLKQQEGLSGVRFLREYGREDIETPVSGFSAVVGVLKTEQAQSFLGDLAASGVKGRMYTAEAEIRVFSPYRENGSGLSELVSEMLTGLQAADEAGIITEATASSIEFDKELNSVFRRLSFKVEFCLCEEGSA